MKKLALIISLVMLVCTAAYADKKKKLNEDTEHFRYDIEYCKTAADGLVMVKTHVGVKTGAWLRLTV